MNLVQECLYAVPSLGQAADRVVGGICLDEFPFEGTRPRVCTVKSSEPTPKGGSLTWPQFCSQVGAPGDMVWIDAGIPYWLSFTMYHLISRITIWSRCYVTLLGRKLRPRVIMIVRKWESWDSNPCLLFLMPMIVPLPHKHPTSAATEVNGDVHIPRRGHAADPTSLF